MKYFAAIQFVVDPQKSSTFRQVHVEYLERMVATGKIYSRGKFADGLGGLTVYQSESVEEARTMAEGDPFVIHGARRLEFHEWEMKPKPE